jgi:hypothetical protein
MTKTLSAPALLVAYETHGGMHVSTNSCVGINGLAMGAHEASLLCAAAPPVYRETMPIATPLADIGPRTQESAIWTRPHRRHLHLVDMSR